MLADPALPNSFGTRLRALREAAGLTQEELAEKAGLTSYAVSALERGRRQRPYPHTVRSLADALDTSDAERAALTRAVPSRSAGATAAPDAPDAAAVPEQRATDPRPAVTVRAGLPTPATRLVGRDAELTTLVRLLTSEDQRLVTLTGTGGVGKTRLATAVAAELDASFPDGTTVVPLASLSDPSGIVAAIARAVGCPTVEGPDAERLLAEHLAPLRMLLVLDNLEHLLTAAESIADLVGACPRLVVLVTSRAPLRVRGETEHPLSPLAVPAVTPTDLETLSAVPAVAVFADRARAVAPSFSVTAANAPAVAGLCRRLAGIPLALELAAARVRFLNPQALLARLDDAMARAGGPDLPERQRTMRATFDWSYELLDVHEQGLFRLLSVFVGGCTLEAVEQVAEAVGSPEPVLSLLEVLVEHSLVVVGSDHEGAPRFSLLEPAAQYARSKQTPEEARAARDAHAAVFLAFAEQAAPEYQRADQVIWLDRAEREDANLTAAITWSLSTGDADTAGRLGWELWLFWWSRGRMGSGRRLMEEALQLPQSADVRWKTLNTAACMAFAQGDLEMSGTRWTAARELALRGGDPLSVAQSTAGVGLVRLALGDLVGAEDLLRSAQPGLEDMGPHGDWLASLVQVWLGTVQMLSGRLADAAESMSRGLELARRRGDRLTAYIALYNLSQLAVGLGALSTAREQLHEGVRLTQETGDLANLGYLLEALAVVESDSGDAHRVAVLLGAAEAVREAAGRWVYGYYKPDAALRDEAAATALAALGEEVYGDALDTGRGMSYDDAVAYVLTGDGAA